MGKETPTPHTRCTALHCTALHCTLTATCLAVGKDGTVEACVRWVIRIERTSALKPA